MFLLTLCDAISQGYSNAQSRQSAKLISSRRNWDFPTPLAAGECVPPSPLVRGGGTLACGRGVGGVQFRRGDMVLYIYKYFVYFVLFLYAHRYVAVDLISATEDLISGKT